MATGGAGVTTLTTELELQHDEDMSIRPGFGLEHPQLLACLANCEPVASAQQSWLDGQMPLEVSAYLGRPELPDELISSIRCIVQVGHQVVMCQTPEGLHPWPGGRRRPGESHWETAQREVHEETGWVLEQEPFELLGWLHFRHRKEQAPEYPWPHPDFCQLVYRGRGGYREGGQEAGWTDTEGWESNSLLVSPQKARAIVEPWLLADVFLDAVASTSF